MAANCSIRTFVFVLLAVVALVFSPGGCPEPDPSNQAPTADAGQDVTALVGETTTLSGAGSSDPDGDALTYSWQQKEGPQLNLAATGEQELSITWSEPGTYRFELTVDDGKGGSDTASVQAVVEQGLPDMALPVKSEFPSGDDGWRVEGGSTFPNPTEPAHKSDGGYVSAQGEDWWYWVAPAKFHGNATKAYGKTLTFDQMFQYGGSPSLPNQWVIVSGGGLIVFHPIYGYGYPNTFTHYSVRLDTSGSWYVNDGQNYPVASEAQIRAVLANLGQIQILGNIQPHRSGGLDNVVLGQEDAEEAGLPVSARFDSGDEGWRVQGGASLPEPAMPAYNASGYLTAEVAEDAWYWTGPSEFRGNFSAAYGKALTFDQMFEYGGSPSVPNRWVVLSGGGHIVFHRAYGYGYSNTFSHYSVLLDASEEWYVNDAHDYPRATEAQLRAVLKDLGQVQIGGNLQEGRTGGLDNVVLGHVPGSAVALPVSSDFESDADGWQIQGGSSVPELAEPTWDPSGYVTAQAPEDAWYWVAPAKFHGNLSGAYGKSLTFEQMFEYGGSPSLPSRWVVLSGGGYIIYHKAYSRGTNLSFSAYAVRFDASEEWFVRDNDTDPRATEAQIQAVLSDLGQLLILGNVQEGRVGALDSVVFGAD